MKLLRLVYDKRINRYDKECTCTSWRLLNNCVLNVLISVWNDTVQWSMKLVNWRRQQTKSQESFQRIFSYKFGVFHLRIRVPRIFCPALISSTIKSELSEHNISLMHYEITRWPSFSLHLSHIPICTFSHRHSPHYIPKSIKPKSLADEISHIAWKILVRVLIMKVDGFGIVDW